jgi:hypothetical protein
MSEVIVSIRMPHSLLEELKRLAALEHYLDLSEELRSIIRQKYLESKDPYLYEIKKLRDDIAQELHDKHVEKARKQVVSELNKIKEQIENN